MRYSVFADNIMHGVYSKYNLLGALLEASRLGGHVFDWWEWRQVSDEEAVAVLEKKHAAALQLYRYKRPALRVAAGT